MPPRGYSSRGRGNNKPNRGGGRHFSSAVTGRLDQIRNRESSEEDDNEESSSSDEGPTVPAPNPVAVLTPEMAALNLKLGNTVEVVTEEPDISRAERRAKKKAQAEAAAKKGQVTDGTGKKKVAVQESESESVEDEDKTVASKAGKGKASTQPVRAPEMSRKEREAQSKKEAQERYQKLHAQGKTQEAKSDLARLQEIRKRREAAAAQREAEAAGESFRLS
ncbi:hypothetical protein TREMEDRAFT_66543 [Tremella mesenterica DSM 1558]|uniref:uncharacterized protein n=1 Tax=Tremella mesenterica (strain ATCC 24925 / CBS 8224 / DSM 1558 / NBRC 9311 / NRRL Y-6157 / RJB 2259-6 / UBC 559-6) TaxID=578456 RepID=UPI00032D07B3|nr:uncharacterized protein TREMEDRAFT_66543 [Tremella mesenterica DSM 1558]EIW65478.1 hypothetical protein TREMEDRAFT_66543 [Tremella mesenterica DSM 1558]